MVCYLILLFFWILPLPYFHWRFNKNDGLVFKVLWFDWDIIKDRIGGKLTHSFIIGSMLFLVFAFIVYISEPSSNYKNEVASEIFIDKVNDQLSVHITKINIEYKIKFLATNGIIHTKKFQTRDIIFDGGNKVVTYKRTRKKGFRQNFLGKDTISLEQIHLEKELSKYF